MEKKAENKTNIDKQESDTAKEKVQAGTQASTKAEVQAESPTRSQAQTVANQSSADPSQEKRNKKCLIVLPVLLLVGAVIFGVAYFFSLPSDAWYDQGAKEGSYEGKSEEEIIADLNRQVEEGMMNISIASTITFETGTSEGEARIDNIASNKRDQKVFITLDETGETVYESGAIPPGSYVQKITLNRDLEPGTYAATATFTGYDMKTHEERGSAAAQIRLVVLS